MANITLHKGNGGRELQAARELNPFRAMRDFFRWDPFMEMAPIAGFETAMSFSPAFEVKENKDGYTFKADLPGMKEQDVEISATGNRLDVRGKREAEKEEKSDTYYVYERSYGSFARSFTLPDGADIEHIKAELKDGVLTIGVPKSAAAQPKKITVQSGEKAKS